MSQPGWLGSLRVAGLYFAGVIFGSLAASVVQPTNYLVGASAGVYALIAAHLGEDLSSFSLLLLLLLLSFP
jgi:rhomboid-related protein 1/2/3